MNGELTLDSLFPPPALLADAAGRPLRRTRYDYVDEQGYTRIPVGLVELASAEMWPEDIRPGTVIKADVGNSWLYEWVSSMAAGTGYSIAGPGLRPQVRVTVRPVTMPGLISGSPESHRVDARTHITVLTVVRPCPDCQVPGHSGFCGACRGSGRAGTRLTADELRQALARNPGNGETGETS